jgi:hypothetical protein
LRPETDGARGQVNLLRSAGRARRVHDREEQFELVNIHLPAPIGPRVHTGGLAPQSSILIFRIRKRAHRILYCGQVLAASSILMYPPNFVNTTLHAAAPRTRGIRSDARIIKEGVLPEWLESTGLF